jgi:anaerobic ribonucleoside-triphosphate reductase activating protein
MNHYDSRGLLVANIRNELAGSTCNGPGNRYVVWFQGCSHGCLGCYNPNTWSDSVVNLVRPLDLAERILSSGCDGVTFTGGEPMFQSLAFFQTLLFLHDSENRMRLPLGVVLFTGHTLSEINSDGDCKNALSLVDVAICGRFERDKRSVVGLRGSTNQEIWWNDSPLRGRSIINEESITSGQVFEAHPIDSGVVLTGFPDIEKLNIPGLKRK